MSQPSPYTPGEIAHEVPGRADHLDRIADLLAVMSTRRRLAGRVHVFVGPRGVGKTSLLREAQRQAEAVGHATVFVTAGHGDLVATLVEAIGLGPLRWQVESVGSRLRELGLSVGVPGARVNATFEGGADPTVVRRLEDLLRSTARASHEDGRVGTVIFIDELQAGDRPGLRALAYAWQHLQADPDGLPLALVGAGLGHTEDVVTDAASFAERFAYRQVGSLEEAATREALSAPATALGVAWEMDALTEVVDRTRGYPYFVQVHGDAVWDAAGRPDPGSALTRAHVAAARQGVVDDLDALYRSRWSKASPSEQRFLTAMAGRAHERVRRGDIASALGVSTEALGMARRSLMDKGLIEVAGHGLLSFTVPGFREFVRESADLGEERVR
ncbi:AAA family ATPase [Janibacter sp. GS2]|uniref:AAA family ATPase n=1 Tax=Janibacter sp. GS2 TaxID=3442646 RepID=UPI003EC0B3A7